MFPHEHEMFTDEGLREHMRHGDDKPGATDQTGFRGHPLCGFCGNRFYDSDQLYEHCRDKHERCFLCDRRDSRQPHYYYDYNALEEHFRKDHYLCPDRECLEKKFVVFESEMDLKAHQLTEHGASMAKGRDARTVDLSNFDLRQRYEQERRAGASARGQRRRGPDPNAEPLPVSSAQPLRRDELAFQRQMALLTGANQPNPNPPGPSRPPPAGPAPQPPQPARPPAGRPILDSMENLSITDYSSLTPEQRATLTRHGAVIERASNLLANDGAKMATFRSHISAFNRGSMTPEQLLDAFFALFSETSSNALGTLVREVADLFEDKRKGEALRKVWQNWRAINEDYPSLPGLGGMRGATTATTGWAAAAATTTSSSSSVNSSTQSAAAEAAAQLRHSTRVLKLKNSTRGPGAAAGQRNVLSLASGGSSSSNGNGHAVHGGARTAASLLSGGARSASPSVLASPSAFPALPGSGSASSQQQPSWIGGSSSAQQAGKKAPRPPAAGAGADSEEAFPALPAAPKPQTTMFGYGRGAVRRDFGVPRDTGFSWGSQSQRQGQGGGDGEGGGGEGGGADGGQQQQGGKKKNKKQVLVHWG